MDAIGILFWLIGGAGAIAFAFNLAPQVRKAWKKKDTGLSYGFFALAYVGNIGSCAFVMYTNYMTGEWQWPLYFNYTIATILTTVLLVMRWLYKK